MTCSVAEVSVEPAGIAVGVLNPATVIVAPSFFLALFHDAALPSTVDRTGAVAFVNDPALGTPVGVPVCVAGVAVPDLRP